MSNKFPCHIFPPFIISYCKCLLEIDHCLPIIFFPHLKKFLALLTAYPLIVREEFFKSSLAYVPTHTSTHTHNTRLLGFLKSLFYYFFLIFNFASLLLYYGLNYIPPKFIFEKKVKVLTPRTSECAYIWRYGL